MKAKVNAVSPKSTNTQSTNQARPFSYQGRSLACSGVSLESLAQKFGTPLYVYSGDQILERRNLFAREFAGVDHTVCYAVKANSSLAILKLLAQSGTGFDIVSGGELERVLRVSKDAAKRVVFSGVGKQAAEMDLALKAGILMFNVESEAELELLAERAAKLKKKARIALRVNPDVFAETHPYISTGLREHKFGIDIRIARKVYRRAAKKQWLEPAGVSVHIGSQIRSTEPFGSALARVVDLVKQLRTDGLNIRYVDAGGGLGPGRFFVAQAGTLLSRVLYTKVNGTKTFVITDAAMNDLIRPALYQAHHEILPVKQSMSKKTIVADIVGPVCESGDFFARDRELPAVKSGDLVALLDAGAYGMSLASNYNTRSRVAEVLVRNGKTKRIRRRETVDEMLTQEVL
ncbi:MAG: diaminopimelate decarboxylase [Acidobacteria bacterium]|nr:diaminopimelate decarboxylase [Acidobacteriota bacterium]